MNEELKEKWVKALRSGRYKQTQEALHDEDGRNCCLGVLCRAARIPKSRPIGSRYFCFDGNAEYLSPRLLQEFGLAEKDMFVLVDMNDGSMGRPQSTFREIADYIEENL